MSRTIRRELLSGHIWSVAGGNPTGPAVILTGRVLWSRIPDATWGRDMMCQHLSVSRGWMGPGDDLDAALRYLKESVDATTGAKLVTTDISQSQTLGMRVEQVLRPQPVGWSNWSNNDPKLSLQFTRLSARPIAPDAHAHVPGPRHPRELSLLELPATFNDVVSRGTDQQRHGASYDPSGPSTGRTVLDVSEMTDEDAPGLTPGNIREALTTVSGLRPPQSTRGGDDDDVTDMGLGATETVAAALALMVVMARENAPASSASPAEPWGWGGSLPPAAWSL